MHVRGWRLVLAVATIHLVAQVAAVALALGGLARFDGGGPAGALEAVGAWAAAILAVPLVTLVKALPIGGTGQWGWLVLVANSLFWGVAINLVFSRLRGGPTPVGLGAGVSVGTAGGGGEHC
jgi:hypothetical protein